MDRLLFLLLLGLSRGQTSYQPNHGSYQYSWSVADSNSGNQYGHSENRLGPDTQGNYHVLLPDGRTQTVTYTVDPTGGFQAKVDFVGEASYGYTPYSPHKPPFHAQPKPIYSPPKPIYSQPKPIYSPPKPIYSQPKPIYSPPKPIYSPPKPIYSHHQPSYAKPYLQASPSNYHSSFTLPQSPSYNSIIYTPSSYIPAPIQNVDHEVHNLVNYKPAPTHAPAHPEHITPLSPPETHEHEEPDSVTPDPYSASAEQLKKMDFTGSFFYPYKTNIKKGYRKLGHEKEEKSHNHV